MTALHVKMLLLLACAGVALGMILVANRRPDVTDPAEIARMPPEELRDVEIECLVRAAFREARSAHIKSEAAPSITVTDPVVLGALCDQFAVGCDDEQLPMYRHPGLTYTWITFDGPYTPELVFKGPKDVALVSGKPRQWHHLYVRTKFGRALADLLGLKLFSETSKPRRANRL
ncbi:MAG TPA: hypothetical protein VG125_32850 [Pirellulales bacterium]|jgi:hypothetical protein|nr:hypothetical protein [Pirellulales bacterium]